MTQFGIRMDLITFLNVRFHSYSSDSKRKYCILDARRYVFCSKTLEAL